MSEAEILERPKRFEGDNRRLRLSVAVGLLSLLACAGCQNTPPGQTQNAQRHAEQSAAATKPAPAARKTKPQEFGFNVLSAQKELCCSDTPSKPVPDGMLAVQGITPDDWRFVLSCFRPFTEVKTKSGYVTKWATQEDWLGEHTASIEHGADHYDTMTIYNLGPSFTWTKWTTCTVINRIDRAGNMFGIDVRSSEFHQWKGGAGYVIRALGASESYTLTCVQGTQSPCVSVAPGSYWGVRDGSEMRICDGQLGVVCTCQITREQAYP